jgi:SagB-type dehydrogenase family enzyme
MVLRQEGGKHGTRAGRREGLTSGSRLLHATGSTLCRVKTLAWVVLLMTPLPAVAQIGSPVRLPPPRWPEGASLEAALSRRRSVREFADRPVALPDLSRLLWAAQGVTSPSGGRTAPSAGARYPLEVLVVAGNVAELPAGIYRYRPATHDLVMVAAGDRRRELMEAAGRQESVSDAAAVLVMAAVPERTSARYGERGTRYVHIEIGHATQNACLAAAAGGLGTVVVGAFDDGRVAGVVGLGAGERPFLLLPVGWPRVAQR